VVLTALAASVTLELVDEREGPSAGVCGVHEIALSGVGISGVGGLDEPEHA
jgi:hypothetical protein